jgi:hypothetical protein
VSTFQKKKENGEENKKKKNREETSTKKNKSRKTKRGIPL